MRRRTPPLEHVRKPLTELRNGLLRLHKQLLESERASYERDVEPITSTGQYLQLVLGDPRFTWLREISQFVVVVDETLEQETPATLEDAMALVVRARALLIPSETGNEFARRYFEAMDRDPGAVLAHGEMVRVLASLG